jgi:photosystem II stability/assembly factor-like uncharacterized protein
MWYNDGGCVLVHPESANVVITGGQTSPGYFGVSVSRDSGRTWTRFTLWSFYADFCYSLAVAPSQPRTLYAGGRGSTVGIVFRSTDLGTTWDRTGSAPDYDVYGLAVHPTDPATVIAASASGIYRTTDSGDNWTKVNATLGFYSVRFLSAGGDTVAAAGDSGVLLSTNGGTDWQDISAGLQKRGVACLEFARRENDVLIVGTRGASCWAWEFVPGVEETPNAEVRTANRGATIVRGVLFMPPASGVMRGASSVLLDAAGRKVMDLHTGANDVSRLSPGVYFVREAQAQAQAQAACRVVVVR